MLDIHDEVALMKMKKKSSKIGKLTGMAVGFTAAAPALFGAFGWTAVIICVCGAVAFTILIVKELKKK